MAFGKADIVNMALSDIGHFTTFTLDSNDDLADAVNQSWQRCIDHCISLHDWKDFRRTSKLTLVTDPPDTGWTYAHELPGDRIGEPLKILCQAGSSPRPLREFEREGNYVFSEAPDVWARCKVEQDPASWDAGWRNAFVVALAGYLAVPVLQNTDMKADKHKMAFGTPAEKGSGGLFGRLMGQDRASSPLGSPVSEDDPLTHAHGGTGRLGGPWYGRWL